KTAPLSYSPDMLRSIVRATALLIALITVRPVHAAAAPIPPPAPPLITQAIDSTQLVELAGSTRPEALVAGNDRGMVADDFPLPALRLQLRRPPEREAALAALLDAQQDPASPYFHRWLEATEFGQLYGPAQADIDTVVAWLQSQGFVVNRVYESGMTIA